MELAFEGGCRSDDPPVGPRPFVTYSENLRWRRGAPETIGPVARVAKDDVTLVLPNFAADATIFQDRDYVVIGSGKFVHFLNWTTLAVTTVATPDAANSGRWWFDATETHIIGARSSLTGRVVTFARANLAYAILANSPVGAVAGGIIAGVLMLAGTTSFAANPKELLVRWSARRDDPSSSGGPGGPFGFEDWTPSDLNASGEILLDSGAAIVGGGTTSLGFLVWTDRTGHLLTPRTDLLAFNEKRFSSRGMFATNCWTEVDGRVWWHDQALVLNVFDGGAPRPIVNPMRLASIEAIDDDPAPRTFMTSSAKFSETILTYPDRLGTPRQLVYNYDQDCWYPWRLDRNAISDQTGKRPSLATDKDGHLWVHDLGETLPYEFLYGQPSIDDPFQLAPRFELTPLGFLLASSIITTPAPYRQGIKRRNAVLSYQHAAPIGPQHYPPESITLRFDSYDEPCRDAAVIHSESHSFQIGKPGADYRAGGKGIRVFISASAVLTFIRFGTLFLDVEDGARR